MQNFLVGTVDGIFRCGKQGPKWTVRQHYLQGNEVPCIATRPDNRSIVYAGTRFGGLFKSADGGSNWVRIGAQTLKEKNPLPRHRCRRPVENVRRQRACGAVFKR